jgi:large subunit ribosomal protein L18
MARGTIYKVVFRRRREDKTDYHLRKRLIMSGSLRLVIRKSLNHMNLQIVEAKIEGDRILAHANTIELKKFGWKGSTGNLPAAYLAGYLLGKRAIKKELNTAIVDFNGYKMTGSNRLFASLKGVIDAGVEVPHDEKVIPEDERVSGAHIAKYAESLQKDDPAKYQAYFSQYLAEGITPERLVEHFKETKGAIDKEVQ